MRIIPVIDVMDGVVVHAIGGQREDYRPIRSTIVDSTDPLTVAKAMLEKTGSREIYIADLNAIRGKGVPSSKIMDLLPQLSATVWLDHGVRRGSETPNEIINFRHVRIVVGTETCMGLHALSQVLKKWPEDRIAVSIDVYDNALFGNAHHWNLNAYDDAILIEQIAKINIINYILLDLSHIGRQRNSPLLDLCRKVRSRVPDAMIMTGGGIHSRQSLDLLDQAGVDAVLMATAIHDGSYPF